MMKKYFSLLLCCLMLNLTFYSSTLANTKFDDNARLAQKIKTGILKLGTGKDSRVEIKLKKGNKVVGYIDKINETSFTVIEDKTNTSTEIPYPIVKSAKGKSLSKGAKIAIGVGIVVGLLIVLGLLAAAKD